LAVLGGLNLSYLSIKDSELIQLVASLPYVANPSQHLGGPQQ